MSKTGAPRKAPLSLNGLRAQQAEARGEKHLEFQIHPEGVADPVTFTVLRRPWWPVKVLVAMRDLDGDVEILRELLGESDFDRLLETGFDIGDMNALFDNIMGRNKDGADEDEEGISLGESSGSSES